MKELLSQLNQFEKGSWQDILFGYTIKVLIGIVILIISFWLINRLVKATSRIFLRRHITGPINSFFRSFVGAALKIIVILFVLNMIGIQTTSVIAIVGAAGLAIGLALQGTLTNLAGGVMLLLFKPFTLGDTIEAQGKKGLVKEIQIFTTLLITPENKIIIIPNSLLSNGIIENHGKLPAAQTPVV